MLKVHKAGQNGGSTGSNKEYIRVEFSNDINRTSVNIKNNHRREIADFQKEDKVLS